MWPRWALLAFALAGCGRFGFEPGPGNGDGGGSGDAGPRRPSMPFVRIFGGPGDAIVRGVALLPDGNLMLGGSISQPTDLGGGLLPINGTPALFAAGLTGDGTHRWSWSLSTQWLTEGGQLAPVGSGAVLAGYLMGSGSIQGNVLTAPNGQDGMWLRLAGDGSVEDFSVFGGDAGNVQLYGVGSASDGTFAVAGVYASDFVIDGAALPATLDSDDGLAVVFDAAGNGIEGHGLLGANNGYMRPVAFDGLGTVAFGGTFGGTLGDMVDADGAMLTSVGGRDGVIAIYSAAAAPPVFVGLGTPVGNDRIDDLVGLSDGGFVMCGLAFGSGSLGPAPFDAQAVDVIIARLGADGAVRWLSVLGGTGTEQNCRLALDGERLHVVAGFIDPVPVGADTLISAGGVDLGFVTYALSDGSPLKAWRAGGQGDEAAEAVAFDPTSGDLVVVGSFLGATDLGGVTAVSTARDAYVYRFSPPN